jgi:glyoxylase-like metal-dependent hydrolase (beta-lactamase superfamily II)
VSLHSALVAEASLPRAAVFAGEGFEAHPMVHQVFQIVYPHGFVLVDTGFPPDYLDESMGGGTFHQAAWQSVRDALGRARAVVITHEHGDHVAGLAHAAAPEALPSRVRLTVPQLANDTELDRAGIPPALRARLEPLPAETPRALLPGIVLVPAAGHTPGSQLVYVRLADGTELLLLGDVAWHMDQLRQLHYRPRLVTDWFLGEDRGAVMAQWRTLHGWITAHPEVHLVVSHDADQRRELIASGILKDGLESVPGTPRADGAEGRGDVRAHGPEGRGDPVRAEG